MEISDLLSPDFTSQKDLAQKIHGYGKNSEGFKSVESLKVYINNMLSGNKTMSKKFSNAYQATLRGMGKDEDYIKSKLNEFEAIINFKRIAKETITSARIGVGHFLFSAPIVGEVLDSYINKSSSKTELKLTSYGNSNSEPIYYRLQNNDNTDDITYFTANDLKDLINDNKLDIVCTASEIFNQDNDADAIPICSIAETVHYGVYPILFSKNDLSHLKKLDFDEYVEKHVTSVYEKNGGRKIPIFYLKETLSENFLEQFEAIESRIDEGKRNKLMPIPVEKPTMDEIIRVRDITKSIFEIDENNFIFPIWEPTATKIRHKAKKEGFEAKYLGTSTDRLVEEKDYFDLDLYVNEKFLSRNGAVPFLIDFISKIEQRIKKLDEKKYYQATPEGQQILKYFEMDDSFWKRLEIINFDVRYYPTFIDFLRKKYKIES